MSRASFFACLIGLSFLAACGGEQTDPSLTGWRKEVGKVRIGANMSENQGVSLVRWETYEKQLSTATGLPVEVFQATDYNGIIQAMASGQLEFAQLAPASYANARAQMGETIAPILTRRNADGLMAYYSALVVRADSPYQTLEDLRGKTIGFVDFNSTSGYVYPRWVLDRQGRNPDAFFGESAITGGHTQSAMALANGQFDAVFMVASGGTPETGFTNGTLPTLARRGLIEMKDFRIIWTAGPIPNEPLVVRTDKPQAFQDISRGAIAALAYEDPVAWAAISLHEGSDMAAVSVRDYEEIVAIRNAEVAKARSGSPGARP